MGSVHDVHTVLDYFAGFCRLPSRYSSFVMDRLFLPSLAFAVLFNFPVDQLHAEPIRGALDPLILTGRGAWGSWGEREVRLESKRLRSTDGSSLLEGTPGVAVVRNGSQTGLIQMRGLTGDRVKVLLDDVCVSSACPNQMDPPMHYASAGSDTQMTVTPGVTPVSYGGDSLGGTIRLMRPEPVFAEKGKTLFSGQLSAKYQGSHDGYGAGLELGAASDTFILDYRGGWSTADDLRYPEGRVRTSGYTSQHHDVTATLKTENGFVALDTGLTRTRDAGTAVLPMDMIEADSWRVGLRHVANFEQAKLESRIYFHSIDHLMDNYSLRNAPKMKMEAPSTSQDYGLRSALEMKRDIQTYRFGIDLHQNDFDANQEVVSNGKTRDMFADNKRSRAGLFAEWETEFSESWGGLFGVRADYVSMEAGKVTSEFGPPPVSKDAAAFNAGDRSHHDWLVDLAGTLSYQADEQTRYELSAGIKNRAPSLLERYLWTPLSASAGRADGRTYLGNTDLDPETSYQITASATHRRQNWQVSLAPFYNRVQDYIQGSPTSRPDSKGQPVLQFQNFDWVELYGLELAGSYAFTEQIELAAQLSYVRGRNLDSNDNLYRIAPLHGLVDLGWQEGNWEAHAELEWADAQNKVSEFNGESSSSGYALLHLRGGYQINTDTRIEIGVENVFDTLYSPHLAGINRVAGSDVAVGESIPGAGRFFYANVSWAF